MDDWRHVRTERLWLDVATVADVPDLHAIHADPQSWEHFPAGRHADRLMSEQMVVNGERQWREHRLGYWSVRDREGGSIVGRGGCAVPPGCPWWNLYYRFASSVHRRGYASEMARAAIEAANDVEPERPVLAYLLEHNVASRRTAERIGLRLVWRGPDVGNPDRDAIRLVYVDREPDEDLAAAIARQCEPIGASDAV
ncbi:GNAT family N-acetyltransferase [Nocardioides dongkuii]|uniref:GNAT family N-acetyltransferase n=1 Tax=Nocardioides dongkuii TaxID=2760089 RepID=UPI0015FE3B34|nr:GNAT family N-acetyltransferase [Nocardioides dongkuii]